MAGLALMIWKKKKSENTFFFQKADWHGAIVAQTACECNRKSQRSVCRCVACSLALSVEQWAAISHLVKKHWFLLLHSVQGCPSLSRVSGCMWGVLEPLVGATMRARRTPVPLCRSSSHGGFCETSRRAEKQALCSGLIFSSSAPCPLLWLDSWTSKSRDCGICRESCKKASRSSRRDTTATSSCTGSYKMPGSKIRLR